MIYSKFFFIKQRLWERVEKNRDKMLISGLCKIRFLCYVGDEKENEQQKFRCYAILHAEQSTNQGWTAEMLKQHN